MQTTTTPALAHPTRPHTRPTARSLVTFANGDTMNLPTLVTSHLLGIDDIGPIAEFEGWEYYLTDCCGAPIRIFEDGTPYCKHCFNEADSMLGLVPEGRERFTVTSIVNL